MTTQLDTIVTEALCFVAPDLEGTTIDADADLQDDFGLDSMDSLNLVAAIKERTGIEIPDREFSRLRTVASIAAWLEAHPASS
jgi:acyl carrier protein